MNFRNLLVVRAAVGAVRGLCCLALLCLFANVQAAGSEALSLRAAIAATLAANPELDLYPLRQNELASERSQAALRPALQVNAGAENIMGSAALQLVDAAEFTLSLSRVVELGEQRSARLAVNGQRQQRLQAEQRITELDLLTEVSRRFIATAAAQSRLALQDKAVVLAEETLAALQQMVSAGQSPRSEELRATALLTRARLAQRQAVTELELARIRLAAMWRSQTPEFPSVSADLLTTGTAGDLSTLLLQLDDNPDLELLASEERLRAEQVREAQSAGQGTVQWTAGLRHLRGINDTALVVGMSMPLGSQERAAPAIAAASARMDQLGVERELALNRMRTALYTLHLQLQQAIMETSTLRDEVLPQLELAQEETGRAYLGGRYSYLELISARQEYLDTEQALIAAATAAHLLRTEIERLSGAALDSTGQERTP